MKKSRKLIATFAVGAAFAGHSLPPAQLALSLNAAMDIARREIIRLGLAATYHVSAFYAGVDRQTEGAAFAAIVSPGVRGQPAARSPGAKFPRLKLLIHEDGHATLQPIPPRHRAQA